MGGVNSRGGSERWINVCLSSPSVAAAATCVCLEKGRYTALQSEPINRPSSGRHVGGPPHKDSPYGVTPPAPPPTHFQVLHPVAEAVHTAVGLAGLFFFFSLFKAAATRYCQQAPGLDKDFLSKRFPEEKGRWARGRGGGAGVRGRVKRAASRLHLLSLSNYLSSSPPHCPFLPPFRPSLRHRPPPLPPSPPRHRHPVVRVGRSLRQAGGGGLPRTWKSG